MAGPVPMPITCCLVLLLLALGSAKVRRATTHAILLIIAHRTCVWIWFFLRDVS